MRTYPYFDCPLTEIPSEENLLAIIHGEATMSNDERRSRFLCHLRLMCLNFLQKDILGTASNLLIMIENEVKDYCNDEDCQFFCKLKLGLHVVECEINDCFDNFDAVNLLESIYFNLKQLLQNIMAVRLVNKININDDGSRSIESHTSCINLSELKKLSSLNIEEFFTAFVVCLHNLIAPLSEQKYFIDHAWETRTVHLDENDSTERFTSYLSAHISALVPNAAIKIHTQRRCLDGNCDILITTPSGELIPIEAKNSNHSDLWTALESQLIKKYMQNINQFGIYLVYWLGENALTNPPKRIKQKPTSHIELKQSLEVYCIPNPYEERVKVFCINCSDI